MLNTPVVLIMFRRPDLTARVLEAIAQVKPRRLLVVADGPRPGVPDDAAACERTRAVINRVDWDCEVLTNYSPVNLGCGSRPATGIDWAFEHVDRAIILEDDCIPHPSFFRYCEELLERYRDDERIMHIGGLTLRRDPVRTPHSYFFSQFNIAAGAWATWRRAWCHFDPAVTLWRQLRDTTWLRDLLEDEIVVQHWAREFALAHEKRGAVSFWDHQWTFACWAHSGLSILPPRNLASNVGSGAGSTHMVAERDPILHLPAHELRFPLIHPPNVLQQRSADREFIQQVILPRMTAPSALREMAWQMAPRPLRSVYRKAANSVRSLAQRGVTGILHGF